MKKILIIVTLICLSLGTTNAQNESRKWSFGASISVIDFSGPLTKQFFNLKNYRGNQRYFVGRYLNPSFNLKADFTFGKVWFPKVTAYPDVLENIYENRHIYDFGLNLEYKLNNGYILKEKAIVAPYIFTGFGINSIIDYGKADGSDINTYIPFGLGFTFRATNWLAFNLQTEYKLNIDNAYDYTQHTAGVVLNFGGKPKGSEASETIKEAVDSDNDGVTDLLDECPFAAGTEAMFGCPDTDGDGIGDSRDDCPKMKGALINKGCPSVDADGDGIPDDKDSCPNIKGEKRYAGCPDTDGDGIVDKYDKCPNKVGVASNSGCPMEKPSVTTPTVTTPVVTTPTITTPTVTTPVVTTPTVTTPVVNKPVVTKPSANTTMDNETTIYFGSASDVVPNTEKAKLDKVVKILNANPSYRVNIKGYTDNKGDDASNVNLSLQRATTVWMYLNNKANIGDRAELFGFGEYDQKATSDKGNRRVVLEIVK